jgi:membrane AbrB-like protein
MPRPSSEAGVRIETLLNAPVRAVLLGLAVCLGAGALAAAVHLPLPWMIGPLWTVAALRIAGVRIAPLPGGRQAGQWVIGTALGLYFTPQTVDFLGDHLAVVGITTAGAVAVGLLNTLVVRRLGAVDSNTAFFSALPGGASEMAVLAERFGGAVDRIAAAHALRVMLVVAVIPFGLTWLGAHGQADEALQAVQPVAAARLPALLALSLVGTAALGLLRVGNAWVIGPILGVGAATASGMPLSALPAEVLIAGQVMIGWALGCRFGPGFFRAAPRFLVATLAASLLAVACSSALGLAMAPLFDSSWPTLMLAAAPGGVAEMCITAKVLQLGVALVTVCHTVRVIALTVGAPLLYRLAIARRDGSGGAPGPG